MSVAASEPAVPRVVAVDPLSDDRWASFVANHPAGSAFLHPGWLGALRVESGATLTGLLATGADGAVRGVLPLLPTKGLPFNVGGQQTGSRLASLPRTPVAGPLGVDDAATATLLRAAIDAATATPGRTLQLKVEAAGLERLVPALVAVPWRPSYVIRLPDPPARVRFGDARNNSRIRWAVNKAERLGVRVREADSETDLRAWYGLYLRTMREHAVPPRAFRFFRALWHRLRPPGVLRLLLAEQGARLIAGSIFLSLASTVHYAFNGSRREDFALRPNDAILWQAIHDAADEGRGRFDLGEVVGDQSGLAEFKSKWGAEEVPLWRYYHPAPRPDGATGPAAGRLIGLAEATWRRLPLPVTAVVGDYLYRRL